MSNPGIGPISAAWLLVSTLNFTLCEDAGQLSAIAGMLHPSAVMVAQGDADYTRRAS